MKLNNTLKIVIGGLIGLVSPLVIIALTGVSVYLTRDIFMTWGFEVMILLIVMFASFIAEMNLKLKGNGDMIYNVVYFAMAAVARFLIIPPILDGWLAENYTEIFTEEQFLIMEAQEWNLYRNTVTIGFALMLIIQVFVILSKFRAPERKD